MTLARAHFTTALLSLAVVAPMTMQGANAACLDDVAALRAEMQRGHASTRDHDAEETNSSPEASGTATIKPADTGAMMDTDVTTNTGVNADVDAEESALDKQEGDVEVTTTTGDVTVPVGDGQPRENWFGRPPSDITAAEDLDKAELAAREGDEDACRARLEDAKAALSADAG